MSLKTRTILTSLPILGLLAAAAAAQAPAPPAQAGLAVPRPDLSAMQPAARQKIEALEKTVDEMRSKTAVPGRDLSEAFGFLGQLFQAFDLPEAAETCYSNALTLNPKEGRWSYYRGLARNGLGNLDGAVADYRRVLELDGKSLPARIRLGDALLDLGRFDQAEIQFQAALELPEGGAAAHFGLGRAAAAKGDSGDAVRELEAALAADPEASAIHYPLAQAYRRVGKKAEADREQAVAGDRQPRFPDPLAGKLVQIAKSIAFEVTADLAAKKEGFSAKDFLGYVLSQLGGVAGAVEPMRQVVDKLDASPAAPAFQRGRLHYALGALLVGAGRDSEAIAEFRRAVELDPDLLDARIKLGNTLARAGRFTEAAAEYDRVLAARPDDRDARAKRAAARSNAGDLAGARADLEKLLAADPGDVDTTLQLARLEDRAGATDAAVARLEKAAESTGTTADQAAVHLALADIHHRRGDLKDAALEYDRAYQADPRSTKALSGLAGLLGEAGRYLESAVVYRRWVDLEPKSVAARLGEATALILGGEHAEAKKRLEEGLAALPGNLDLIDVLARHLAACPDRSVRDGRRAVELALQLYKTQPTAQTLETLAMAYAEAGDFDRAIEWQTRLLDQAGDDAAPADRARWKANLERYRQKTSCCAEGGAATGD